MHLSHRGYLTFISSSLFIQILRIYVLTDFGWGINEAMDVAIYYEHRKPVIPVSFED
jgi:hypothetical protein